MTEAARRAHARLLARTASGEPLERLVALAARLLDADGAEVELEADDPQVVAACGDRAGTALACELAGPGGERLGELRVHRHRPFGDEERQLAAELAVSIVNELELGSIADELDVRTARLELGLAAAQVGSFDWDLRSGHLAWDERLMALFGYDPDTFTPHIDAFLDRVHPDDRARVRRALDAAIETCGEYAAEYRIVLPDGRTRWIAARGRVLTDADGLPLRLLGAAYDTTEAHDARQAIARQLETMASAFYSLDDEWRFTYVNGEAERLLGRHRDELLGRVVWDEYPEAVGSDFERQYRWAVGTGEHVVFEAYYPPPLDGWYEVRAWPGPDGLAVYFADVTARHRADERLRMLVEAGDRFAGSLDAATTVSTLLDLVVPMLGELAVVVVTAEVEAALTGVEPGPDAARRVHVRAVAAAQEERLAALEALVRAIPLSLDDEHGAGRVIRTGEPQWLPTVPDEVLESLAAGDAALLDGMRQLDLSSALTVPLVARGRPIGALTVTEPAVGELDRRLVEDLAARAAAALDGAILYAQSRRVGLTLQRSLLPPTLPESGDLSIAARYQPGVEGIEVGGDFYIAHELADGRLVLAIGDVMGRGIHAAAVMGQLRSVVLTLVHGGDRPDEVLGRLGPVVDELLDLQLATLLLALYDPASRVLQVASAGHPPPLLAPIDDLPRYLELEPGPPLGSGPASHPLLAVDLPSAATLVLYTDGLIERRDQPITEGMELLREALIDVRLPPAAVCEHALRKTGRFEAGDDDVALLVLSHR